jgi:hypothetical protein
MDQTPQERREQIVALARGERGEQGERGAQGARGEQMSLRLRRSLIYLFAAAALLAVLALAGVVHEEGAWRGSQLRQSQMIERKLCVTLDRLAARKPPAGSAADNPSRGYLQWQHDTLAELGPDLGCGHVS